MPTSSLCFFYGRMSVNKAPPNKPSRLYIYGFRTSARLNLLKRVFYFFSQIRRAENKNLSLLFRFDNVYLHLEINFLGKD